MRIASERLIAAIAVVLAVVSSLGCWTALVSLDEARHIESSRSFASTDPRLAAREANAAYAASPSRAARATLWSLAQQTKYVGRTWKMDDGAHECILVSVDTVFTCSPGGEIVAWSPEGGLISRLQLEGEPLYAAISVSGRRLAMQSDVGVTIINSDHGKLTRGTSFPPSFSEGSHSIGIGFSPDETKLVGVFQDQMGPELTVWSLEDSAETDYETMGIRVGDARSSQLTAVYPDPVTLPEWSILVSTRTGSVLRVTVVTAAVSTVLYEPTQGQPVTALAGTSTGRTAVASDSALWIFGDTQFQRDPVTVGIPMVSFLSWLSDSQVLAVNRSGVYILSRSPTGRWDWESAYEGAGIICQAAAGQGYCATPTGTGVILNARARKGFADTGARSNGAAFDGRGFLIMTESNGGNSNTVHYLYSVNPSDPTNPDGTPRIVGKYLPDPAWWPQSQPFFVNGVTADGDYVVSSGLDPRQQGVVLVWDRDSGRPLARLPFTSEGDPLNSGGSDIVTSARVLPRSGRLVAYNHSAGEFRIWTLSGWIEQSTFQVGALGQVVPLGDERHILATDSEESRILMIDLDKQSVAVLADNEVEYVGLALAHDGSAFATANWRRPGVDFFTIDGVHISHVSTNGLPISVAWDPTGNYVAVSLAEGGVQLLGSDHRLFADAEPLLGASMPVTSSWSSDGRFLAISTLERYYDHKYAGPVFLWDMKPDWPHILDHLVKP